GTAGLVAAVGSAGIGARVVMVEREQRPGGDCLWTGCVPSKSLIASAKAAHLMRTADRFGLPAAAVQVDLAKVMLRVREIQETISHHDSTQRMESLGVDVIRGEGRFTSQSTMEVNGLTIAFRAALIATGAQPALPPIEGLAEADPLTSDTIWGLDALPQRIVVLGGGAIGCELGQALARLGAQVTIVEMVDRLMIQEEPEASEVIERVLAGEGIEVLTGTKATRVTPGRDGAGTLHVEGPTDDLDLPFDRILVATGRTPNTADIGLEALGVELTKRGHVVVDETMRTSTPKIFAAGDVTTRPPFTHVAGMDASAVVMNAIFGLRRKAAERVLWATFTDPEVGRVGMSEAQARQEFGDEIQVRTFAHDGLDRAITEGRTDGFTKIVADDKGRIVGATIVSPTGGEQIATIDAWIRAGAKMATVGTAMHAYPTYAEGIQKVGVEQLRDQWLTPGKTRLLRPLLGVARAVSRVRSGAVGARSGRVR
ncbi:MAG: pyruvate/2-oxoglutarate dehydrogenase complex dihydrolipoamide dehydrogenase (E3) component, partial [Glaciecola sp.]